MHYECQEGRRDFIPSGWFFNAKSLQGQSSPENLNRLGKWKFRPQRCWTFRPLRSYTSKNYSVP